VSVLVVAQQISEVPEGLMNSNVYVRATCFDLVGHPQALQGNGSKSFLVFLHSWIPNAHRFQVQKQNIYKVVCLNKG